MADACAGDSVHTVKDTGPQSVDLRRCVEEGQQKLSAVENCQLVLQLSVNPQVELSLDAGATVRKAEGINEDGKQLLAVLELTGLSCGGTTEELHYNEAGQLIEE